MHQKLELPGIERIRARFLEMLEQRQSALAEHALAAWEGRLSLGWMISSKVRKR